MRVVTVSRDEVIKEGQVLSCSQMTQHITKNWWEMTVQRLEQMPLEQAGLLGEALKSALTSRDQLDLHTFLFSCICLTCAALTTEANGWCGTHAVSCSKWKVAKKVERHLSTLTQLLRPAIVTGEANVIVQWFLHLVLPLNEVYPVDFGTKAHERQRNMLREEHSKCARGLASLLENHQVVAEEAPTSIVDAIDHFDGVSRFLVYAVFFDTGYDARSVVSMTRFELPGSSCELTQAVGRITRLSNQTEFTKKVVYRCIWEDPHEIISCLRLQEARKVLNLKLGLRDVGDETGANLTCHNVAVDPTGDARTPVGSSGDASSPSPGASTAPGSPGGAFWPSPGADTANGNPGTSTAPGSPGSPGASIAPGSPGASTAPGSPGASTESRIGADTTPCLRETAPKEDAGMDGSAENVKESDQEEDDPTTSEKEYDNETETEGGTTSESDTVGGQKKTPNKLQRQGRIQRQFEKELGGSLISNPFWATRVYPCSHFRALPKVTFRPSRLVELTERFDQLLEEVPEEDWLRPIQAFLGSRWEPPPWLERFLRALTLRNGPPVPTKEVDAAIAKARQQSSEPLALLGKPTHWGVVAFFLETVAQKETEAEGAKSAACNDADELTKMDHALEQIENDSQGKYTIETVCKVLGLDPKKWKKVRKERWPLSQAPILRHLYTAKMHSPSTRESRMVEHRKVFLTPPICWAKRDEALEARLRKAYGRLGRELSETRVREELGRRFTAFCVGKDEEWSVSQMWEQVQAHFPNGKTMGRLVPTWANADFANIRKSNLCPLRDEVALGCFERFLEMGTSQREPVAAATKSWCPAFYVSLKVQRGEEDIESLSRAAEDFYASVCGITRPVKFPLSPHEVSILEASSNDGLGETSREREDGVKLFVVFCKKHVITCHLGEVCTVAEYCNFIQAEATNRASRAANRGCIKLYMRSIVEQISEKNDEENLRVVGRSLVVDKNAPRGQSTLIYVDAFTALRSKRDKNGYVGNFKKRPLLCAIQYYDSYVRAKQCQPGR